MCVSVSVCVCVVRGCVYLLYCVNNRSYCMRVYSTLVQNVCLHDDAIDEGESMKDRVDKKRCTVNTEAKWGNGDGGKSTVSEL